MKINKLLFILIIPYLCIGQTAVQSDSLGPPTKSYSNFSKVIGWKNGETPLAPAGFTVTKYADGFENPRWMYVTPNGDILVAQSNSNYSFLKQIGATLKGVWRSNNLKHSANIITLLRDNNKDGIPDLRETFLDEDNGLNQPFGMLVIGNWFYVANTNAILRYPYKAGQTKIIVKGEKVVDLPAGKHNQH